MDKPVFDKKQMTLTYTWEQEDEQTEELIENVITVPARFAVCDRCGGHGTHVRPGIDDHGISQEEWAYEWDEDDREAYLNGAYDMTCSECNGCRVCPVVDEDRIEQKDKEAYKRFEKWREEDAEAEASYRAERDAERRMGC